MENKREFDILVKSASNWVAEQEMFIIKRGRKLSPEELEIACRVNVENTNVVRILEVDAITKPSESSLNAICEQLGFLSDATIGLTLNSCIFIKKGYYSKRLLSHELRHVYQYQQQGSVEAFLSRYIQQIIDVGYDNSSFEIDARQHEVSD